MVGVLVSLWVSPVMGKSNKEKERAKKISFWGKIITAGYFLLFFILFYTVRKP